MNKLSSVHTTARDFFLYLALAVTLIWLVASTFLYSFEVINFLITDTLDQNYWYGSATSVLMGAMASLIIVTPFFLVISSFINRDLKQNPEKKHIWVRKWLLYFILFVSFVVTLGDLVILLGGYLRGDLTARFIWKAFVVLLVSIAVFGYFLYDLRREPKKSRKIPIFSGAALSAIVVALVIIGFMVAGTPAKQRDMRLDQERVNSLQSLTFSIEMYYRNNEELPETIFDLDKGNVIRAHDPVTGEPYDYQVTGERMYELCATFERASSDRFGSRFSDEWEHDAGSECFERQVEALNPGEDFLDVRTVPVID